MSFIVKFLIIVLISCISYSKEYGEFSCFVPQYGYINGILNEQKTDAIRSARLIEKKLSLDKDVNTIFNKSHGTVIDLLRSIFQKIDESNRDIFFTSRQNITLMFLKRFFGKIIDVNNISKYSDSELTKLLLTDNQKNIDESIIEAKSPDKRLAIVKEIYMQIRLVRD
jgi:hypothetical protein